MTQAIVTYLNAVIDTVGRVDERYCIAELRSDGTATVPYAYVGNGKVKPISIDGGSLSYWRISGAVPPMEQIASQYGKPRLSATYPLRLVIIARRKDSTVDDGFMPTRLAEDIANALTGSHPDLKTLLKANTVSVSAGYDVNITSVWADEFKGTGVNDPNYTRTIMALSVSVTVVGDRACWENECDYDPDILHLFDFCQAGTVARLTPEQVTCLEAAICDPCEDATITVNSNPFGTAPSGGGLNVPVVNGGSNPVGSKQGSDWVIDNNATFINGIQVTDQEAEVDANIFVTLDGAQSGTWNAGIQTWEVTSAPVAYPTTALPMKTGQTVSYQSGDDGDFEAGRSVSFLVLSENNPFGNTNRFTDIVGGQTYAAQIAIDWSTYEKSTGRVVWWYLVRGGIANWTTAISSARALTVGGYTNWRLPNFNEMAQIYNLSIVGNPINYAPFNSPDNALWLGNTAANAVSGFYAALSTYGIAIAAKTAALRWLAVRTGNISELVIP